MTLMQVQQPDDSLLSDGVMLLVAGLLIIAIGLALAAAPLLRWAYGRRVRRLMGLNQVGAQSQDATTAEESGTGATSRWADTSSIAAMALERQRRVVRATFWAWLTFAAIAPFVAGVDPAVAPRDRLYFLVLAAAFALIPALSNLPEGWSFFRRQAVTREAKGQTLFSKTRTSLALWYRRLRGQVMPIFVVLASWIILFFGIYAYFEPRGGDAWLTRFGQSQEGSATYVTGQLIFPLAVALFLWVGFHLLDGLAQLIRRGWVSELSLTGTVMLMVIAVVLAGVQDERHSFWSACAPLLWVLAAAGVYVLVLGSSKGGSSGPQLLVLRVFSRDHTKQVLLDQLQDHWRYVGPVQQIGGPDMVDLNVSTYNALMFLSNRLHELYLPAAPTPARLQARLRTTPDHDGRFPINELFCFNTAWRSTVDQLMYLSDAIVLDVRGLTAQREGTSYEIGLLARDAALGKVVAVSDETTDWGHVEDLLRAAGADPWRLARIPVGNGSGLDELFGRLLQVAGAAHSGQV